MAKKTKVVFRMFEGDVIALFPELSWDETDYICTSYMHNGQHGAADFGFVMSSSRPATPKEFESLLEELKNIGYENMVVQYLENCPLTNE